MREARLRACAACCVLAGLVLAPGAPVRAQDSDLRLVNAVRQGDREAVRALARQVDVNARQPDGAAALHWAAYLDDLETAALLLDAGARPNAANALGVTPLHLACENGNAALVRRLLAAGAAPDAALPSGETALMTAARAGSVGAVTALLARGADVNARETTERQTALMWAGVAAASRRRAGADRGRCGRPCPLARPPRGDRELAAHGRGRRGVGRRGGRVHGAAVRGPAGRPRRGAPAAGGGRGPRTSRPRPARAPSSWRPTAGTASSPRGLLDQGADPNAADAGYAPLHAAVLRGDAELVSALLDHGAHPNARLAQGTPHARYGKLYALEMRLAGATPFFLAAQYGFADVMQRLAAAGADPRAGLAGGVTPLMAAAGMLTPGFIQAGNDRRGRAIDTAEMEIALSQDPDRRRLMNSGIDAVRAAVALGADVNAASESGDTALHVAAHHGFNSVVRYLVGRGADPNAQNARGQTPLDFALGVGRVPARNPAAGADPGAADLLRELGAR